jgi:anti-anti-sigma factor
MTQTVTLSSDRTGEHTQVLTLDGRCDASTAAEAEQSILAALGAGRTRIIFDLRGVISLAPSFLPILSRGVILAKAQNGELTLVRPNAHVWALFEEHGLNGIFPNFSDLKEAAAGNAA